ncbi:hypothetical protein Y1Q_0011774 [Alligator mississippiensis]|uniref:Uncharacterized protein n=1 Tax=Alligator mississippiensis TaxID=8496 RepID=A0A151M120_ALLMI|nr:hypothetical protein Y1Q_0011774 [Alligator mississippiensis]
MATPATGARCDSWRGSGLLDGCPEQTGCLTAAAGIGGGVARSGLGEVYGCSVPVESSYICTETQDSCVGHLLHRTVSC